jgi:Flp pilus assembly protein TadD
LQFREIDALFGSAEMARRFSAFHLADAAAELPPSHSPRRRFELMSRNQNTRFELVLVAAILLLSLRIGCNAIAGGADEQVCDVGADYSLGVEDYTKAIRLHREVVRRFPEKALAHYHLGFALGMMGDRRAEFS